jgi:hypothetical protein
MDSLLIFPRTQAEKQFLSELMNRMGIKTAAVPPEYLEDKEDIRLFDQAQLEAGEPVSMDAYLKSRTSRKKKDA